MSTNPSPSPPAILLTLLALVPGAARAADGDFDATFHGGQPAVWGIVGGHFLASDAVVRPNGKVRIVGSTSFMVDGWDPFVLDVTSSAFEGYTTYAIDQGGGDDDRGLAITAAGGDSYFIGGRASTDEAAKPLQGLLMKIDADGDFDPALSPSGWSLESAYDWGGNSNGQSEIRDVVVLSDGSVAPLGRHDHESGTVWRGRAWRRIPGASFVNYGQALDVSLGSELAVAAVAEGANLGVVMITNAPVQVGAIGSSGLMLTRLTGDEGTLDPSFGNNGVGLVGETDDVFATSLARMADGRYVAGGYRVTSPGTLLEAPKTSAALWRFEADGDLDPTFGNGGRAYLDLGSRNGRNVVNSVAVQPDGRIVVTGYTGGISLGSDLDLVVARIQPGGIKDPTFGNGGVVRVDLDLAPDGIAIGKTVLLTAASRITVVGTAVNDGGTATVALRLTNDRREMNDGFESGGMEAWAKVVD